MDYSILQWWCPKRANRSNQIAQIGKKQKLLVTRAPVTCSGWGQRRYIINDDKDEYRALLPTILWWGSKSCKQLVFDGFSKTCSKINGWARHDHGDHCILNLVLSSSNCSALIATPHFAILKISQRKLSYTLGDGEIKVHSFLCFSCCRLGNETNY